jgi:tRNA modification GTPase
MATNSVNGLKGDQRLKGSSHHDDGRPVGRDAVRVALLTPVGRGALAVVGAAGPGAQECVARLFVPRGSPLEERPRGAVVFGRWTGAADGPGEELVVVRRATDDLEIHCHGGLAASEAVITSLEQLGAMRQAWPEWLRSGGTPEIEVEAREALAIAGGPKAARILSRQMAGGLDAELVRVGGLVAKGGVDEARVALDRLGRAARVGLRLTRPWRVVLAGSVNAGKSSLVNALAGHARSIVSPEPGTTRDLLETRVVLDGWEVDLVDTAGLREDVATGIGVTGVERAGIARAVAAREGADLVLRVVDGRQVGMVGPASSSDRELLVASKADLAGGAVAAATVGAVWTSAISGAGITRLAEEIVRRLVPEEIEEPELLDGVVPFTARQVALVERLRGP